MGISARADGIADPIITKWVEQGRVSWYRKRNLRVLYLLLFPTCMGVEMTSGFDSQIINAVQLVDPWQACATKPVVCSRSLLKCTYRFQKAYRGAAGYNRFELLTGSHLCSALRATDQRSIWKKMVYHVWIDGHDLGIVVAGLR